MIQAQLSIVYQPVRSAVTLSRAPKHNDWAPPKRPQSVGRPVTTAVLPGRCSATRGTLLQVKQHVKRKLRPDTWLWGHATRYLQVDYSHPSILLAHWLLDPAWRAGQGWTAPMPN